MTPGDRSTPAPRRIIDVAIGVLVRHEADGPQVLITRRPAGSVYADYWEFPGGKCEPGEPPAAALVREFDEELALPIAVGESLDRIEHIYPHGHVRLHPFFCHHAPASPTAAHHACGLAPPEVTPEVAITPQNLGVAEHRWIRPADLPHYRFPEANVTLIRDILNRFANES